MMGFSPEECLAVCSWLCGCFGKAGAQEQNEFGFEIVKEVLIEIHVAELFSEFEDDEKAIYVALNFWTVLIDMVRSDDPAALQPVLPVYDLSGHGFDDLTFLEKLKFMTESDYKLRKLRLGIFASIQVLKTVENWVNGNGSWSDSHFRQEVATYPLQPRSLVLKLKEMLSHLLELLRSLYTEMLCVERWT